MDGESPSFSAGDIGEAVGKGLGTAVGAAFGPIGMAVGGLIGGKAGGAVGNAAGSGGAGSTTNEQGVTTPVDDFSLPYGPGSAGPATSPGAMPDVVASLADDAPGAGGDMGVINRTDPPPQVVTPQPEAPSVTPPAPDSVTMMPEAPAPAAPEPAAPPAADTPATLAANRGPIRVVRGRGARRLLLYDAQSGLPSVLGG